MGTKPIFKLFMYVQLSKSIESINVIPSAIVHRIAGVNMPHRLIHTCNLLYYCDCVNSLLKKWSYCTIGAVQ